MVKLFVQTEQVLMNIVTCPLQATELGGLQKISFDCTHEIPPKGIGWRQAANSLNRPERRCIFAHTRNNILNLFHNISKKNQNVFQDKEDAIWLHSDMFPCLTVFDFF